MKALTNRCGYQNTGNMTAVQVTPPDRVLVSQCTLHHVQSAPCSVRSAVADFFAITDSQPQNSHFQGATGAIGPMMPCPRATRKRVCTPLAAQDI